MQPEPADSRRDGAIFNNMVRLSKLLAPLLLTGTLGLIAIYSPASARSVNSSPLERQRTLEKPRELWATVDICNPKDKPNTFGIRGSMPSDGHPKDMMYMRLRVQYLDAAKKTWLSLTTGGDSGFVKLGSGRLARQSGLSVELAPVAGTPAFTLRGYANFQWRRGKTILQSIARATTSGHTSLAGADPHGFSAATCKLG